MARNPSSSPKTGDSGARAWRSSYDVIGVDKTPGGAPVALLAEGDVFVGQAFIALPGALRDFFWRFIELEATPASPIVGLRMKGATWIAAGMTAKSQTPARRGVLTVPL